MAVKPKNPIELRREDAEYPLHYSRKALSLAGTYKKMDVVTHDTEVANGKGIPLFRATDDIEKQLLHLLRFQNELLPVCPSNYMVLNSRDNFSWVSHTLYVHMR